MTKSTRAVVLAAVLFAGCTSSERAARSPASTRPTEVAIDPVIARIREEGLKRSQVMETLDVLCNVIGPRLTASPGQQRASEWTRDQLAAWGLSNAHLESWGPFGRGWSVDRFSMRIEGEQAGMQQAFVPIGYPKAWSPGLDAPLSADVVFLDAKNETDLADYEGELAGKVVLIGQPRNVEARFEPLARRLTDAELDKLAAYEPGRPAVAERQPLETASERRARFAAASARNETILSGARPTTVPATRSTLRASSQPTTRSTTRSTTRKAATTASATTSATSSTSSATTQSDPRGGDPLVAKMLAFAADEGAALIVTTSPKGDGGTYFVQSSSIPGDPPRRGWGPTTRPRIWSDDAPKIPPQVLIAIEDYNRIARATRQGESLRATVDLATSFHGKSIEPSNTIAEIPGTDLAHEVVMIGAHLDSWHSGTGATDNAVGSACAMEAVRIIRALDLKPRRTIRVALWTGEEQGLFGSSAYVKRHFGYEPEPTTQPTTSPATMAASPTTQSATAATQRSLDPTEPPGGEGKPATLPASATQPTGFVRLPDYERLSVYFNLDNGTGRIRGIFAQGNKAAVPHFRTWLQPFADLDAKTVSLQDTGSTDHIPFDQIGLPGFQFIQDPMEYSSRTHHSNMDVYDRIQAEDAKQASTIMAAFLWQAANMDKRFPRKPFPKPEPR